MNTIKLCGGLGNQFFQYAFGKAQIYNGIDVRFDSVWYRTKSAINPPRFYVLDKFNTYVKLAEGRQGLIYREGDFDLSLLCLDGFYFSGYWQYPEYSKRIISLLRDELRLKQEYYTPEFIALKEKIASDGETVAVHVRRGDYLRVTGFPVMSMEYYQRALERVSGKVYVFSDDIEWCQENFKDATFVHLNECLDFELMRLCTHQVISRSSYGWWAAHLNDNPKKVVVAPKQQLMCVAGKIPVIRKMRLADPKGWIHVN